MNSVKHIKEYELEFGFTDGTIARLNFQARVASRGGVFGPFQNVEFFKQVTVDQEAGTLTWPNGVDFCPDVLYSEATGKASDNRAQVA